MTQRDPEKFLPDGRQWLWSAHSLGIAKDCPRKYFYKVVCGWETQEERHHARFGIEFHAACDHYEGLKARGGTHDEALHIVVAQTLQQTWNYVSGTPALNVADETGSVRLKSRENLIRTIIWYLEEFRDDPCATVILADGTPAVELSFTFAVDEEISFRGRLDRIVTLAGDYYVQDKKTTGSAIGSYYFKRYNPDNEMSLFTIAADVVWKTPVKGVMIDAAQIAVGFSRFGRGFTFRTPDQSAEWLRDADYYIRQTWAAEAAGWPMNDSACQKYGGCEFIDICSKSPQVREDFLNTKFTRRTYGPA